MAAIFMQFTRFVGQLRSIYHHRSRNSLQIRCSDLAEFRILRTKSIKHLIFWDENRSSVFVKNICSLYCS